MANALVACGGSDKTNDTAPTTPTTPTTPEVLNYQGGLQPAYAGINGETVNLDTAAFDSNTNADITIRYFVLKQNSDTRIFLLGNAFVCDS